MDAYGYGAPEYLRYDGKKFKSGGFAVVGGDLLQTALAEIVGWEADHVKQPDFIFPVRPSFTDIRMQIQRSGFTYHPPHIPTMTEAQNSTLRKWVISVGAKSEISKQLKHLGMDHFSVFGDLDYLAKTTRQNWMLGM